MEHSSSTERLYHGAPASFIDALAVCGASGSVDGGCGVNERLWDQDAMLEVVSPRRSTF